MRNNITYQKEGDYLITNIVVPSNIKNYRLDK